MNNTKFNCKQNKKFCFSLKDPQNPSNILWNNLEKSNKVFYISFCRLLLVLVLLFCIFFWCILLIQTYRSSSQTQKKKKNLALVKICDKDISINKAEGTVKDLVKWSINNSNLVDPIYFTASSTKRFAKLFSLTLPEDIPVLKPDRKHYQEFYIKKDEADFLLVCFCNHHYETDIKDKRIGNLCSLDVNQKLKTTLIIIGSAMLISLVNLITIILIPKLIARIPLQEVTSQKIYEVLLTSFILYINTAVVPLLVNSSFVYSLFRIDLLSVQTSFFSSLKVYYDFEREWYFDVGSKIALSLLINIIVCTFFEFIRLRVDKRYFLIY